MPTKNFRQSSKMTSHLRRHKTAEETRIQLIKPGDAVDYWSECK